MTHKSILLFALVIVSASGGDLFEACLKDDIKCLSSATETFVSKTYSGVPDYGLEPTDPIIVPSVGNIVDNELGFKLMFTNVNMSGFKSLKLDDFKIDTTQNTVVLKLKVDLHVLADGNIELIESKTAFKGPMTFSGTVLGTSKYIFSIKEINGKQHFVAGPESTTCEVIGGVSATLGEELQNALLNDKDASKLRPKWLAKADQNRKSNLCNFASTGFRTVIDNLRKIASVLPKEDFFKDI